MTVGKSVELEELFHPRSVAVIGASNRPGAVGTTLFRNILKAGFKGVAYPVNPSWPSVSGVHCYRDVAALPEVPELGVVIVPAPLVAGVMTQLGKAGTKGVIVISSGFRELGGDGVAREDELIRIAEKYRMSLVGPNCFGLLNTDPAISLNSTFSESLPPGGTSPSSPRAARCARAFWPTASRSGSGSPDSSPSGTAPGSTRTTSCTRSARTRRPP